MEALTYLYIALADKVHREERYASVLHSEKLDVLSCPQELSHYLEPNDLKNSCSKSPNGCNKFERKRLLWKLYFKLETRLSNQLTKYLIVLIGSFGLANPATSAPLLFLNAEDPEVFALQQSLKAQGFYSGPLDASYGELTKQAVMQFQQAYNLADDGVAGTKTQAALQQQLAISQPPTVAQISISTVGSDILLPAALGVGIVTCVSQTFSGKPKKEKTPEDEVGAAVSKYLSKGVKIRSEHKKT
jgi:hypothetical protein